MNKEIKEITYSKTIKCKDCPKRIKNDGNIYCAKDWFLRAGMPEVVAYFES